MSVPGTMQFPISNPWLIRSRRVMPRLRLFCFPYAGKGPSVFAGWEQFLPDFVEVCAVQLPGKEARIRERSFVSVTESAREVTHAIEPLLDLPFALLGHSLGSLLAFEVAREIGARYAIAPKRLFVSAHPAPHRMRPPAGLHLMEDENLLNEIESRYGTIPPSVRNDRQLMNLFLPGLRADVTMLETYRYEPGPALRCPISAFASEGDRAASVDSVKSWRDQTAGGFLLRLLPGDHFFIQSERTQFLAAVSQDCCAIRAGEGAA